MTKLKIYYDGWLALPAALRRKLDLKTDAVLEAELVDGTIVLRPASATKGTTALEPEQVAAEPPAIAPASTATALAAMPAEARAVDAVEDTPAVMPDPSSTSLPAVKRRPGRPRKAPSAEPVEPVAVPRRPRGRPRKMAQSEPAPTPVSEDAHSELRRKVVLPTAIHEHGAVRGRRPVRATPSAGHEREERRPFRQVEVRKLGSGRGHNRPRGAQPQP